MKVDKLTLRIRCDKCGRKIMYRDTFITLEAVKCIDCLVNELDYNPPNLWTDNDNAEDFSRFKKIFKWVLG